MDVATLGTRQPLRQAVLPAELRVYRVQLPAPRPGSVVIGPLILPPPGLLACRFDLAAQPVGYFGLQDVTAVYETLARRDSVAIALAIVQARVLLTARLATTGLRIADLRPHASHWPVLQAARYAPSQRLAADLQRLGYDGALYLSAQHPVRDCLALFGAANAAVAGGAVLPLYDAVTSRLHRGVIDAAAGTQLPVV
ncbi:MAG: RES family NAD+ phosphorylase [Rubrivivax sp.]|nr:RES family NAD+ phosphorylase [Rubrivivax sp.]